MLNSDFFLRNRDNLTVIAGAGVAGCVVGYELVKQGYPVLLIEKEPCIGGLAKSFRYNDFCFDIGPHRFFTHKERISNFIRQTLDGEYTIILRHSEVYFLGRHYLWPLRPTVLFNLPLPIVVKTGWDLLLMLFKNKRRKIDSFQDYILTNYGPSLYNVFFKDYTSKFLGLSPDKVHFKWAKEGMKRTIIDENIASRNLVDILKLFFKFKPVQTEFIYPVKGIGVFCEKLADRIKETSGQVLTNARVTAIKHSEGEIEEIYVNDIKVKPKRVIWTGNLPEICRLLNVSCSGLDYLSLILFNILISKPLKKSYQWCYYGSKKIIFSRVTMPEVFSERMVSPGKSSLCVEVTCREGDMMWNNPQTLIDRVKKDLIKVRLVDRLCDIEKVYIEKITNAYPIYTLDFVENRKKAESNLSKFKNLTIAGRSGLFWYNNMDDSIENGLETADNIVKEKKSLRKNQ